MRASKGGGLEGWRPRREKIGLSRKKLCDLFLAQVELPLGEWARTHGPQAEVAQVFGHELLVELGGGRLEGLEEEQRNGEEKETGEENNHHTTHR